MIELRKQLNTAQLIANLKRKANNAHSGFAATCLREGVHLAVHLNTSQGDEYRIHTPNDCYGPYSEAAIANIGDARNLPIF